MVRSNSIGEGMIPLLFSRSRMALNWGVLDKHRLEGDSCAETKKRVSLTDPDLDIAMLVNRQELT